MFTIKINLEKRNSTEKRNFFNLVFVSELSHYSEKNTFLSFFLKKQMIRKDDTLELKTKIRTTRSHSFYIKCLKD